MKKDGIGGANTKTGLAFEGKTDFKTFLCKQKGYSSRKDEKLQTCDFKKKQYKRLLASLNIDIKYIYLLGVWFKKPEYRNVLNYIISVGCSYYFEYISLKKFNLPTPK